MISKGSANLFLVFTMLFIDCVYVCRFLSFRPEGEISYSQKRISLYTIVTFEMTIVPFFIPAVRRNLTIPKADFSLHYIPFEMTSFPFVIPTERRNLTIPKADFSLHYIPFEMTSFPFVIPTERRNLTLPKADFSLH